LPRGRQTSPQTTSVAAWHTSDLIFEASYSSLDGQSGWRYITAG
jgi:hypothetical protein